MVDRQAPTADRNNRHSGEVVSAEYIDAAARELEGAYDAPLSLSEYVDQVISTPSIAAHSSKYLLDAIESAGTRTVVEEGEKRERYRFFDDPYNDGIHAIQGNTKVLNEFVDDLRSIAAGRGKDEKIIWVAGPTATGKSELKRCLISGLREYSKTEVGRRHTLEWNIATVDRPRGMSYGDPPGAEATAESDWYRSPVQAHPFLVFPETVRGELIATLNDGYNDHIDLQVNGTLDPFSREAYDGLAAHYRERRSGELFRSITDPKHLRVTNYVVDVGSGIGVLHAEDGGTPKQRLVGSWMQTMFHELDSRGRKNAQAFSYDGILSQGNGVLTIIEDASQHADLLQKLLSVPDEERVKLDTGIEMTIDTQLLIISNPDLEASLDAHEDAGSADPLKALKRRLEKHEFRYLTNLSLEAELLRRELTDETVVWTADSYVELESRIRESVTFSMKTRADHVVERAFAPHAIEAAAMYNVLTRLDDANLPSELDLVDKALLYDRGYLFEEDERLERGDFDLDESTDGTFGIPVTYTRDILAELLQTEMDRHHPTLPVENVLMPRDVLDRMANELERAPLFSAAERRELEERVVPAKRYIHDRQEADVLEAMLWNHTVDEKTLAEYVEHVYAWGTDGDAVDADGERIEPDPLTMKVVETERLGRFSESDYEDQRPTEKVESFRETHVITAVNRYAWEERDADFTVSDIELQDIPSIEQLLEQSSWDDVRRIYEDFDPRQWNDPPEGTETAHLKGNTIERMVDEFGYSTASAELTTGAVMERVGQRWRDDD